jgi:hypothetical protein
MGRQPRWERRGRVFVHFIGEGKWSDEKVLAKVREMVVPQMSARAWSRWRRSRRRIARRRSISRCSLALRQPKSAWQTITWREGTAAPLTC